MRVIVELRFGSLRERIESSRYKYAASLFAECAARGAFSEALVAPRPWPVVHVVSRWAQASLEMTFQAEAFDVRGLQVLRNLMLSAAGSEDRLNEIVVTTPEGLWGRNDERVLPMLSEDNEEDDYPPRSDYLGFECEDEEIDDTWVRRCVIEYWAPILPEEVDRMAQWVAPWFNVLEVGAYALPHGPPAATESVPGSVVQFDELSIEISVMKFHASEMAWNALANMVSAGRSKDAPIARLVFD